MAIRSSIQNTNSRYVQGGVTDTFRSRLGWWERRTFPKKQDDILFIVKKKHENRADIIANDVYGNDRLDWLVLQYNTIVDPVEELIAGKVLLLPAVSRIHTILTQSGGNIK